MLVVTSFGGPKSRMFSLAVGITVTLTFSSGSITSLKTLSCPSTTTSWLKCRRKVMKSEQLRKCISSALECFQIVMHSNAKHKLLKLGCSYLPSKGINERIFVFFVGDRQEALLTFCSN
ncbi:hypothetical protein Leryth_004588 [Lithospermum erythrorhizon]|nr:hypothetical protein Leryth_004588 [Lithospermum erythrorhizon]